MASTARWHLRWVGAALAMAAIVACSSAAPRGQQTSAAADGREVSPAADRAPAQERGQQRALGTVDFEVSCEPEARREFQQALALLHNMMYAQARQTFEAVAQEDPGCAMAHWGIAMSLFHPLWADPPSAEELERGAAAVARAREVGPKTARERAYVDAVAAYYQDGQVRDEGERLRRFARATAELHRRYPSDADAAAFYALGLLATAPPEDPTLTHQRQAAATLTEIHERLPRHPGAIHYGIHAHDYPQLAEEGVLLADVYDEIAPDAPHALHMPSHIYVRIGQWRKAADWNRRSADAAARQPVDGARSMHYAHALDYMMYAYLQRMQDETAAAVVEELDEATRYETTPATSYAIAALHARLPLEQRDWRRASRLSTDAIPVEVPWEDHPFAEAVVVYGRGLGAARSGDLEAAERSLAELDAAVERLEEESREASALRYWYARAQVQRDTVAAWIAESRGMQDEARRLMSRAAEREEAAGKHPIMPAFVLPARELLGDLLLEQGQPGPALEAYRASLREYPRRANSLYGAAMAAQQLGDNGAALDYSVRLVAMGSDAEAERPILREAQRYLSGRFSAGPR